MSRPCVVLLPGLLCDDAVWTAQREAFADADCRVPSYGLADSITAMARQVVATLPPGPFSLAGHSMGGRVAIEIARLVPGRVARLAILDSGVDPIDPGDAGRHERDRRLALLAVARDRGMRAMGRDWARPMVHPSRLDTPVFDAILDMIERKTPDEFAAQIDALLRRPDARETLAGVRCPTLLLVGRQDTWSPLERHERMQASLPGSRLVVVEDCGHMSTMEQPAVVATALRAWMQT